MFKNLLYVFRTDPALVYRAVGLELVHSLFVAAPTGFLLLIVEELFSGRASSGRLWGYVATMLLLLAGQLFVAVKTMVKTNDTTYALSTNLRMRLGNRLQHLSMGTFKQRDPGDLASVVLQDVANFELIFGHTVGNITAAIFSTLIVSIFLFIINWRMALLAMAALPLSFVLVKLSDYLIVRQGNRQVRARNETGARFLEYVQGIRHIKAFGMTGARFATLEKALDELRISSIRTEAIPGPFVVTGALALELMSLLLIYWGIGLFTTGALSVAALITFLIVGYRLYEPLKVVMVDYVILRYMNISLKRMIGVLVTPVQPGGRQLVPAQYDISFEQVSFSYRSGKQVLTGVSFHVPVGSMLALVGPSGSGKTTVTSLIARFWDITDGAVKIGGIDVRDMEPGVVYGLISEVFQDVYLFDDTIYNNILFGRPEATEMEVLEAAEKAQVLDFAFELPGGLRARTGEGGNRLSGGQRQRISIARALLKNAPIVLLDEATASLDPENEVYIQQAIQELVKDKTVVVIAHKLVTIRNAQQILVLKEGSVVERGTHETLMRTRGLYHRLWEMQQMTGGWEIQEKSFESEASI